MQKITRQIALKKKGFKVTTKFTRQEKVNGAFETLELACFCFELV